MRIFDEAGGEKSVVVANEFFAEYVGFGCEDLEKEGVEGFFEVLKGCSLDEIDFKWEDISDRAFWLGDRGDMFMLKDKTIISVCWRGGSCHLWRRTRPNLGSACKKFFGLYNKKK